MTSLQALVGKAAAHPRIVFLVDGIGAMFTALLTGVVLTRFDAVFAMPQAILYRLAVAACLFAVYSLTCAALNVKAWQRYLSIIAAANTLYCAVTLGLVVYVYADVTAFDVAYFLGEIGVIWIVVAVEISTIVHSRTNTMKAL